MPEGVALHRRIGSILNQARVELLVRLESSEALTSLDRLGLETAQATILDVEVPMVRVPVRPGRNLAVLIEVATLNQRLRSQGIVAARALDARLMERMKKARGKK